MELSRVAGDGPDYYIPLLAGSFAALAAVPVVCCFLWGCRLFRLSGGMIAGVAVAVAPELVYFGARTLSETTAGNLLVAALYVLEPGYRVTSRRRLFTGGALLGLVFVLRIQLAPALAVVALWTIWRGKAERGPAVIAGAAAVVVAAAGLDTLTLGSPLASLWRYVFYNIQFSAALSVENWHYYLRYGLGIWRGGAVLLLLLIAFAARRMPLLLVVAIIILAVHSGIAHKEYRFIYPAVLLFMVLSGIGLAQFASWLQAWLRQLVEILVSPQDRGKWRTAVTVDAIAVTLSFWYVVSFEVWTGSALSINRYRGQDNLAAIGFVRHGPPACGVGLYGLEGGDWSAYGGYTYLHRPVPMYWPMDEAELAIFASAFDTLVYTKSPPERLGFVPERCFGQVCVARRTGICASLPMMAMPFPDWYPLAGIGCCR